MGAVDLSTEDEELVERVRRCFGMADDEHKQYRTRADRFYALYRNLQEFRTTHARDKDVVRKAQREWGAELFIPFAFRTVETILPRMVAHRPEMNPLPRDEQAFGSVDNMRMLLEMQQEQIKYDLILQDIAKDGLIGGLGVQKVGWKTLKRKALGIKPGTGENYGTWVEDVRERTFFDDPYAEWIDPFDFLWDPYGHSPETCDYLFHRTWRSSSYVANMVATQKWRSGEWDSSCNWILEDLIGSSPTTRYDEVQSDRRLAEGYDTQREKDTRHEVWEYHNGNQVITVLNSEYPVQVGDNPMPDGSKPFQVYRPTKVGGRMVGIGEIEPIEDLQAEINTLRGQRRDAATMALGRGYAFNEQMVNADDLVMGPNIAIPVNGDPRDLLFPLPIADVPGSSYSEETSIQRDIESTSGISDPVTGGEGNGPASQTATGVQLVQQAAGLRIQNKTRRLGAEIIIPAGEAWVLLNQTRILKQRAVRAPASDPNGPAWQMVQLGPAELRGKMSMQIDDGSTMAKNVPQMRQDAQAYMSMQGNPKIDQTWLAKQILRNMGAENPDQAIVPEEPQIPANLVEGFLQQAGIPAGMFTAWLDQQQAAAQAPDGASPAPGGAPEASGPPAEGEAPVG